MICEVIIDRKSNSINQIYEYIIPDNIIDIVKIGHRVKVNFANKILVAYVINIKNTPNYDINKLKCIELIYDLEPILSQELIDLSFYMSKRYFSLYISAIDTMVPSAIKVNYKKIITMTDLAKNNEELKRLFKGSDEIVLTEKHNEDITLINKAIKNKQLLLTETLSNDSKIKTTRYVKLNNLNSKITSTKQQLVVDYLNKISDSVKVSELLEALNVTNAVLNTLIKNDVIVVENIETYRIPYSKKYVDNNHVLNDSQNNAIKKIKNKLNSYNKFLLHGITGSGKTEVYLNVIEEVIKKNKTAILLVPEISLTPQMTYNLKARFQDLVAVLHSRLSNGERFDEWRRISKNEAKIIVGARSAIFAPISNVGIIIIDEEHDLSYKQDNNPKYDTIDLASFRAKYNNCPVVFGSATPSICSYYKVEIKDYELIELKNRVNDAGLPKSEIVDMRTELKQGNKSIFSRSLQKKLIDRFNKGEQSILFLNKRGYSSFVMCRECGHV
ncbi:MAG: replication restart helicase PriA, partial [Anaeroplasmataceae bacterium]